MEFRGWKTNGIAPWNTSPQHHTSIHTLTICVPSITVRVFPPSGMALGVAMVCLLCMSLRLHGWVNGYWQHHLRPLTLFAVLINSAELKQGYTFPAVLFMIVTKATGTLALPPYDPRLCPQHANQLTSIPCIRKTNKKVSIEVALLQIKTEHKVWCIVSSCSQHW